MAQIYPDTQFGDNEDERVLEAILEKLYHHDIDFVTAFEECLAHCKCSSQDTEKHRLVTSTGTGPHTEYTACLFFVVSNYAS